MSKEVIESVDNKVEAELELMRIRGMKPEYSVLLSSLTNKIKVEPIDIRAYDLHLIICESIFRVRRRNSKIEDYLAPIGKQLFARYNDLRIIKRGEFYRGNEKVIREDIEYALAYPYSTIDSDWHSHLARQKEKLNEEFSDEKFLDLLEDERIFSGLSNVVDETALDELSRGDGAHDHGYFDFLDYTGEYPV